ncbi:hypothetical protein [Bosea sp. TND4EK4]|uniref:hypothetical protein n=1 Tax=Bosea sp. TND4EK4 TaxID=1907408 RepID=UPI0015887F51|nr:hypothetical protein [Bosea sp. TND4EK4]
MRRVGSCEAPVLRKRRQPSRARPPLPIARFMPIEAKVFRGPVSMEPKITIEMGDGSESSSSSSAKAALSGQAATIIASPIRRAPAHAYATHQPRLRRHARLSRAEAELQQFAEDLARLC